VAFPAQARQVELQGTFLVIPCTLRLIY